MGVDLKALRQAAGGDQSKKVEVSKRWLTHVADELEALDRFRQRAASTSKTTDIFDSIFGSGRR